MEKVIPFHRPARSRQQRLEVGDAGTHRSNAVPVQFGGRGGDGQLHGIEINIEEQGPMDDIGVGSLAICIPRDLPAVDKNVVAPGKMRCISSSTFCVPPPKYLIYLLPHSGQTL